MYQLSDPVLPAERHAGGFRCRREPLLVLPHELGDDRSAQRRATWLRHETGNDSFSPGKAAAGGARAEAGEGADCGEQFMSQQSATTSIAPFLSVRNGARAV